MRPFFKNNVSALRILLFQLGVFNFLSFYVSFFNYLNPDDVTVLPFLPFGITFFQTFSFKFQRSVLRFLPFQFGRTVLNFLATFFRNPDVDVTVFDLLVWQNQVY